MTTDSHELADKIAAHCKLVGIEPTTFGQKHFKNSRLHERLSNGGSITLPTYNKLITILDSNTGQAA